MSDKPLSVAEVAKHLGVCEATIRKEIKTGALLSTRVGRMHRILPEILTAYLNGKKGLA